MRDPNLFTTTQVAKICHVSTRTVAKWCDSGLLPYYRIPGSADRRITRIALENFIKHNGMPFAIEETK